jgi:hypothetical protein
VSQVSQDGDQFDWHQRLTRTHPLVGVSWLFVDFSFPSKRSFEEVL